MNALIVQVATYGALKRAPHIRTAEEAYAVP
jgi:hypothetical protein